MCFVTFAPSSINMPSSITTEREMAYQQEPKKQWRYNMAKSNEIKYLTAIKSDKRIKKYCRFKKYRIRYIHYKEVDLLKNYLQQNRKPLPRSISNRLSKY